MTLKRIFNNTEYWLRKLPRDIEINNKLFYIMIQPAISRYLIYYANNVDDYSWRYHIVNKSLRKASKKLYIILKEDNKYQLSREERVKIMKKENTNEKL
jgi:hypothetical protein